MTLVTLAGQLLPRHTPCVFRLVFGVLKGAVVGGAIGYGAYAAGLDGGFNWLTYAVIGFLVGLFVGRPIWSHIRDRSSTVWTAVLKGIFGVIIGTVLYAIIGKAWGTFDVSLLDETRRVHNWQFILGGAIGALYGGFVEIDDAPPADKKS